MFLEHKTMIQRVRRVATQKGASHVLRLVDMGITQRTGI